MLRKLSHHTGLKAIILCAMVAASLAPTALVFYRCQMMGVRSSRCCNGDEQQPRGPSSPRLEAERCCTKVSIAVERSPAEVARPSTAHPTLAASTAVIAALEPPARSFRPSWTRAQLDSGPPIILQTCSLLI